MRTFIKHIVITLTVAFGIMNAPLIGRIICLFSNPAKDVFTVIIKSISKHPHKSILLLGDSVCRQVFGKESHGDTLNLCENQAYEIPGNYLILQNLLAQDNSFDTVVLYFNPFSLTSALDQIYTYNYFVKPFRPYLHYLEQQDLKYINTTFPAKSVFDFLPVVRYQFSSWQINQEKRPQKISGISARYLDKIGDLCQEHEMEFRLKSLPVKRSRQKELDEIILNSENEISKSTILQRYFEHVTFLPDSLFLDDVHYLNPESIPHR